MKRSAVGPYFGEASVHQKPINESVFRWGVGPSLTGDSICDRDCDKTDWKEDIRSHENLLEECLGKENRKVALSRKVFGLFVPMVL